MIAMIVSALAVLIVSGPAAASHPMDYGHACNANEEGAMIQMPDFERWVCEYDDELDDYFWIPLPPLILPGDAVAFKRVNWTAADGVIHAQMPRVEWINNVLYTGSDVFLRKPISDPFSRPSGQIGVFSRVWAWNGSTWTNCRESGWAHNGVASEHAVPTFNWGRAPCGAQWYYATAFTDHWNSLTSSWVTSPAATTFGGTSLGAAQNGQVWDPPSGDTTIPPPPASAMNDPILRRPPRPSLARIVLGQLYLPPAAIRAGEHIIRARS